MVTLQNVQTMSQLSAIREHLEEHGWIDKPTALEICDCDRLGARIWDLRNLFGLPISTEIRAKRNRFGHEVRYAVYHLEKDGENK